VFGTEKDAKESNRQFVRSGSAKRAASSLALSAGQATQKEGKKNVLYIIVKVDTKGSLEAIRDTLGGMKNEDVEVRMISDGVGDISESDITMAATSKALVIGFQVRVPATVKALADREKVPVTLYSVVYELFDAIRSYLSDLMPMVSVERQLGLLKVLARFRDNRKNVVLGGSVEEGLITPNVQARVLRGKETVAEGKVVTVRRGRDEVRQVATGSECGMELLLGAGRENVAEGDRVMAYATDQEKKPLGL
jgi:translation initiation factor IF-2